MYLIVFIIIYYYQLTTWLEIKYVTENYVNITYNVIYREAN